MTTPKRSTTMSKPKPSTTAAAEPVSRRESATSSKTVQVVNTATGDVETLDVYRARELVTDASGVYEYAATEPAK